MMDMAIGVDIGGTNLKMGLVNRGGQIFDEKSIPLPRTNRSADVSLIGQHIAAFIEKQEAIDGIVGVGIACPGILDTKQGIVHDAVNLGWHEVPLVDCMQKMLKLPVRLAYDAAAGAVGEKNYGAGALLPSFLYVCLGTGVGASLVMNRRLYEGEWGPIINIGHTSIIPDGKPCKCGNRGCLETYVSASAITEHTGANAFQVYEAALKGDLNAIRLFQEAGELLGVSLVNCIQLFGVGHVIIGGGLSKAGDLLLAPARAMVEERLSALSSLSVHITSAAFPTTAGILGAAALHF